MQQQAGGAQAGPDMNMGGAAGADAGASNDNNDDVIDGDFREV